jgi:hypothetical protein
MNWLIAIGIWFAGIHLGMGLGKYFWGCRHLNG